MLKSQIFGKGGKISSEEKILTYFARIFERDKPRATNCKGPNAIRHLLWTLSDHFFGPKMSIETNIPKNSCFHWDNRFWSVFRRIIEGEKPEAALYRGPQATLTLTVEVVRWFLWDLRGC